ncbi:MAG: protein phosphatase 2C domain-containing protein [Lachnospiraceae bacterium]|nr:protein phosphatase 2C domain-containing protein [Lachnospiraceae bacterium]
MMKFTAFTNPGSREVNEDSTGIIEYGDGVCFVVADGLGGHGKGDIASQLAVSAFRHVYTEQNGTQEEMMSLAFRQAQADIISEQTATASSNQMKTTAVALDVRDDRILWGHVGDSRLYAFSRNKIKTRTLDHSVPQMLVRCREIREKEIRNHPDRNKLLRVLGVAEKPPEFELSPVVGSSIYQTFLLCTDGFWELVLEKEMERFLKKSDSPEGWVENMVKTINSRGAGKEMDNYSAIAVFI